MVRVRVRARVRVRVRVNVRLRGEGEGGDKGGGVKRCGFRGRLRFAFGNWFIGVDCHWGIKRESIAIGSKRESISIGG